MKNINQAYRIKASVERVWQALVDPKYIEGWGGGPVIMDDKVGTKFSLWDGDIHGTNIEVTPMKKLVQEWYSGDWPEPSIATFILKKENGITHIEFSQTNVPDDTAKDVDDGWKDYYLGPLKDYLEK